MSLNYVMVKGGYFTRFRGLERIGKASRAAQTRQNKPPEH